MIFRKSISQLYNGRQILRLAVRPLSFHQTGDFILCKDFITADEESRLVKYVDARLARREPYHYDHFDKVIKGYRECIMSSWPQDMELIFSRMRKCVQDLAQRDSIKWKPIHVLDLAENGVIGPHTDYIDYSGEFVCGLSLLSDTVIKFEHNQNTSDWQKIHIPRKSFYITKGSVRRDYKHSIQSENGMFSVDGAQFKQQRRISLMLRDEKQE